MDPMLAGVSTVLRAASSTSRNNQLRLKLPGDASAITAALTGVYSLLNADDSGGGCGLDTPDIANLVTQMKEESSSSKAAPLTADVLKTVLEIRETLDLQKEKKLALAHRPPVNDQVVSTTTTSTHLPYRENDRTGAMNERPKTPPQPSGLSQQHDIGPCDR